MAVDRAADLARVPGPAMETAMETATETATAVATQALAVVEALAAGAHQGVVADAVRAPATDVGPPVTAVLDAAMVRGAAMTTMAATTMQAVSEAMAAALAWIRCLAAGAATRDVLAMIDGTWPPCPRRRQQQEWEAMR